MKISKAMKKLKKLKNKASAVSAKIQKHNRIVEEKSFIYNMDDLRDEHQGIVEEIITLKVAIMKANIESGNYEKILRIGELRGTKSILENVNTESGVDEDAYMYRGSENPPTYKTQIGEKQMENIISDIDDQIEEYIETLDNFNANTDV